LKTESLAGFAYLLMPNYRTLLKNETALDTFLDDKSMMKVIMFTPHDANFTP